MCGPAVKPHEAAAARLAAKWLHWPHLPARARESDAFLRVSRFVHKHRDLPFNPRFTAFGPVYSAEHGLIWSDVLPITTLQVRMNKSLRLSVVRLRKITTPQMPVHHQNIWQPD